MLLLASATDKIEVVTGQAVTVDVHASYLDSSGTVVSGGNVNTAITTAATTSVAGSPSGGALRNVKTLNIRNKHASSSVDVTVRHVNAVATVELHKATLAAGEALEYIDGYGFIELPASPAAADASANTADVTANAADTYLTGSALAISNRIQAGSLFRWRFTMTKTAAGVATPVYSIRVGTAGSTADTARCSFTGLAQSAATDTGWHEMEAVVRTVSASGIVQAAMYMSHKNTTTGLANVAQEQVLQSLSAAFDLTAAGLIIGVSCNPGAAGVWTFQTVSVEAINLKT